MKAHTARSLLLVAVVMGGCGRSEPDKTGAEPQAEAVITAPRELDPEVLALRKFGEAPMLLERVEAGELPPVTDRLPENPRVVIPVNEIGRYGGTIRRVLTADIIEEDEVYKTMTDSLMVFERPLPNRIALSHAINREEMSEIGGFGKALPGGYSFNQISPYFSEEAFQMYSEHDPDRSRALLEEAGYRDTDGDGFREFLDGSIFRITVDLLADLDTKSPSGELIRDYWQAIGIKIHLNYGLSDMIYPRRLNGEFEVVSWSLEGPADPLGRPQAWATMAENTPFWHRNSSREGPAWLAEATDNINRAMSSIDPEQVRKYMVRVRDLHTENIPVIGNGSTYHVWGYNTRLGNVPNENTKAHVFRGFSGPVMFEQLFLKHEL